MAAVSTVQIKPVASYQEATGRSSVSAATELSTAGATERDSAEMAMSLGIGPQGWFDRAPNWAERATSHL
jgi:hypothetical protein